MFWSKDCQYVPFDSLAMQAYYYEIITCMVRVMGMLSKKGAEKNKALY